MSRNFQQELLGRGMKSNARVAYVLSQIRLTQEEAAEQMGISRSHLSQINTGKTPVTRKTAMLIQECFGYEGEWLLHGTGPFRMGPEGPEFVVGPLSESTPPPDAVSVTSRRAFHCGHCHGEVAPYRRDCPHCGSLLRWLDMEGEVPDES